MTDPAAQAPAAENTVVSRSTSLPIWQRKSLIVLATLVLAAVVFGTTTQTWITVKLAPTGVQTADLHVQGSKAATSVTALALVSLAGALAASIAGRVARVIAAVIVFLGAAGIIVAAAAVIADPRAAAAGAISSATGVTGASAAAALTAFPAVALAAAVLLALAGLLIIVAGRRWSSRTKYDAAAARAQANGEATAAADDDVVDEIDGWDELSRGNDPTK